MYLPRIVYIFRVILYKWSYAQLYLKLCSLRIHGALIFITCVTHGEIIKSINNGKFFTLKCINLYNVLFVIAF